MSPRPSSSAPPASRGRPRRGKVAGLSAAGLTAAALTLGMVQLPATGAPAAAVGPTPEDFRGLGEDPHDHGAENLDTRLDTGIVAPAGSQLGAARNLGADVRWNDFGTPASLLPKDGSLGAASSSDPVVAARDWLRRN